jgi:hypothetical protein
VLIIRKIYKSLILQYKFVMSDDDEEEGDFD